MEEGNEVAIEVEEEDNVHEKVKQKLQTPSCTIVFGYTIVFGSEPLGPEDTFGDHGIEDGARLQIGKAAGFVPRDGLRLWLTAKNGVDKSGAEAVERWANPDFEEGCGLVGADSRFLDSRGIDPKLGENELGPFVSFGYDEWGFIQDAEGKVPF